MARRGKQVYSGGNIETARMRARLGKTEFAEALGVSVRTGLRLRTSGIFEGDEKLPDLERVLGHHLLEQVDVPGDPKQMSDGAFWAHLRLMIQEAETRFWRRDASSPEGRLLGFATYSDDLDDPQVSPDRADTNE